MKKIILDACCGGRMMWFQKKHSSVLYTDNRIMSPKKFCNGATLEVAPDIVMDFRKMKLKARSFNLVVFDPPHIIKRGGKNSWMADKYGELNRKTWQRDLKKGFSECFRVLKIGGILIFKWSEFDIPLKDILSLTSHQPLFGHRSGKQQKTHWVTFMKFSKNK
jgi:hypothetical protein